MLILFSRFDETLTYAIEEFTKYAERMSDHALTVTSRHVPVLPRENVPGAIRFGLLSDFGLDDSCVVDPLVDDVLDIDVNGDTGYIAGSNIRSILLGVYRYFRSAGARWLRPGDDGEIRVLFIGRYSGEKSHTVLIDAVKKSRYRDKIRLVFAGDGPLKDKLIARSKGLLLKPVFKFFSREELVDVIRGADLYVHPAEIEIEAISCR